MYRVLVYPTLIIKAYSHFRVFLSRKLYVKAAFFLFDWLTKELFLRVNDSSHGFPSSPTFIRFFLPSILQTNVCVPFISIIQEWISPKLRRSRPDIFAISPPLFNNKIIMRNLYTIFDLNFKDSKNTIKSERVCFQYEIWQMRPAERWIIQRRKGKLSLFPTVWYRDFSHFHFPSFAICECQK